MPNFWQLIDDATLDASETEEVPEALTGILNELPPDEIIAFQAWLYERLDEAYTWDLWAATYVLQGGCSDDGFEYFRCWLIAQGEQTFRAAVAHPDTLADLDIEDPFGCELEGLLSAADDAYQAKSGSSMPNDALPPRQFGAEPAGTPFEEDDSDDLRRRCPRLWAKYGDDS